MEDDGMKDQRELVRAGRRRAGQFRPIALLTRILTSLGLAGSAWASEDVPHLPFAQWANVPAPGQFVAGVVYQESESYHIWVQRTETGIKWRAAGESYGIDINQGYMTFQYGLDEKWAADLNVGFTTCGWRYFADSTGKQGGVQSTTGLMDSSMGVRYQVFNEAKADSPWVPTLTFRAGAVLPGEYDQNFAFAPGFRSAAIEPEALMRKHFGWPGLGGYFDGLFRWNRTTGNDQYMTVIGLFQQIQRWELDVGYRHLQTLSGGDIVLNADQSIDYPRDVREISDSIEAGFSYTTLKHHIRYGFETQTTFDGSNTDRKFWIGCSIQIPFGGKNEKSEPSEDGKSEK
jgi:hypothetical protein